MAKKLLFDFVCIACGHRFEKLVDVDYKVAPCPQCTEDSNRLIPAPSIDWKMGVNPDSSVADKWARLHEQRAKQSREEG